MVAVANPIYDSVFKYLMEDERIARILLSDLHQREVVGVNVREHEYTNGTRDKIDLTQKDKNNRQIINVDESAFVGDEEMNLILTRLLSAASDAKVRQDMNVEEEYFQAIENRDTAIMMRDQKIKEQDNQIAEQNNQIAEQNNQIAEQNNQIAEQNNQIAEQNNQIAEQKQVIINLAKTLKLSGTPIEQITSMTGLTADEIEAL